MSSSRLRDPLKRPAFRRLAVSYAINEMGDWLGLVALSVLVFELTGSALATTLLFLGTGFLPALLTPLLVARLERPPPRFVLPAIYAAEAAAFLGLALLVDQLLPGRGRRRRRDRRRSGADRENADPGGRPRRCSSPRASCAPATRSSTSPSPSAPRSGRSSPAASSPHFGVQSALLLDAVSFYVIAWIVLHGEATAAGGARAGHSCASRSAPASATSAAIAPLYTPLERPGRGPRLLHRRRPGRGRLRQGNAGCRATPATASCSASWGAGMVIGSAVFATLRRAPLAAAALLQHPERSGPATSAWPPRRRCAVACAACAVGGAGNGVQWVAVVSAVQELTAARMQARVISVLESIGSAMPGDRLRARRPDRHRLTAPATAFVVAGAGASLIAARRPCRSWAPSGPNKRPKTSSLRGAPTTTLWWS